jgi:hypothetical protein
VFGEIPHVIKGEYKKDEELQKIVQMADQTYFKSG